MNKPKTDEQLMRDYILGSTMAFEQLYERYQAKVYGYCLYKLFGHEKKAQDLFQDVFLKLHRHRESFKEGELFAPWFFTIIRNSLIDHLRRNKVQEYELQESMEIAQEAKEDHLEEVKHYLSHPTLDRRERLALELKYLREKNYKEMATELQVSQSNARQIVSRALTKLRKYLGEKP